MVRRRGSVALLVLSTTLAAACIRRSAPLSPAAHALLERADVTARNLGYEGYVSYGAVRPGGFYMRPLPGASLRTPGAIAGPVYTLSIGLRHTDQGEPFLHVVPGTQGGNARGVDIWSSPAPQAVEYADRLRNQCSPPRVG